MIATGVSSWVYADRSPRQQWGGPVDALIFGKIEWDQDTINTTKEKRKIHTLLSKKRWGGQLVG
jgi:hypothetical protein